MRQSNPIPFLHVAKVLAASLALVFAAVAPLHAEETKSANEGSASVVVEGLHEALTQAMKKADRLGYQGRFDLIAPAVGKAIDSGFMAEKSIGRHWRKLSEEQQTRWRERFADLTVANYAGRFKGYSGEHFKTLGEQDAPHDTKLVKTTLVLPDRDDVALNYRLHQTDEGWKVIDVYMNGTVSELSLRRSEYSSTVKRDGFDSLMAAIERKLADFAAGTFEDSGAAVASSAPNAQ